jgi:hypothetical protein
MNPMQASIKKSAADSTERYALLWVQAARW